MFYRRAKEAVETKKRQPSIRLDSRLLAHLRRWQRLGISMHSVIEWNGKPVRSVRKGFASAVRAAGLRKAATPHILRHTAATWAMQNGGDPWQIQAISEPSRRCRRSMAITIPTISSTPWQRSAVASHGDRMATDWA
jgi:integrase